MKSCAWAFQDQFHLKRFFLKFRGDYLPFSTVRASRKRDNTDLLLLKKSYEYGTGNPFEMGTVEILNRKGNVIDYEIIQGSTQQIQGLNEAARRLLIRNADRIAEVSLVRKRHTHPQDSVGSIIPETFSDGDMTNDEHLADFLENDPYYSHIRAQSWIIYLDPDITRFSAGNLQLEDVRVRGYQLR